MTHRNRDNDPKEIVGAYSSWINDLHNEGLSVISVRFSIQSVPGNQRTQITQMQREIETVVDMVIRRMDKFLYPNRSSDLISFFKIVPDYPVPKKKKKPIPEVTINNGLHMNADIPHSTSITDLLVESLNEHQRLYITRLTALLSIYPTVLTYTQKHGVKYDMKAITRRRASLDDILLLPRTANEKTEWSRSECLDRLKGSPDVKGSREGD
jgi:hypothetical protein